MPPKPATAMSQAPASEARCTPSPVLPPIVKIDQGGLTEVLVGEVEMSDLRRHDGLDACRQ